MKSKLPDRSVQTSCKECVFATYDGKTQIGCLADRIIKFQDKVIEAYDNDKEFYVINSFCNYYRKRSWNNGVADLNRAKLESGLSFDVFIDCNDMDYDYSSRVIDFINNIDYYPKKINITLFHTYDQPRETYSKVSNIYKNINKKVDITTCLSKDLYLHETMMKSNKTYHTVLHHKLLGSSIFTKINDKVNNDLVKFVSASQNGVCIYSNVAYKIESTSKENQDYFMNTLSILELSKNSGMYIEL
jgi:hypothetical protein